MQNRAPVLVTAHPLLRDAVLTAAAAAGTDPTAVSEPDQVPDLHILDQPLVIGIDRAPQLAHRTLPPAAITVLVGAEADREELCAWSAPLGATVVVLPEGMRWLTSLLAGPAADAGRTVGLIGGHGGAGTSTVTAALAQVAAREGRRVAVLDLDDRGGGLDLLFGLEQAPGWRWPDLAASAGYIDGLTAQLPQSDGVVLLSMARADGGPGTPSPEAVAAVLRSLGREHDLVLIDLGRQLSEGARQALRHCHVPLLVTGSGVREVAAAGHVAAELGAERLGIAVRPSPHGAGAAAVAEALDGTLWAELPTEPRLVAAAEQAENLGEVSRRWRRGIHQLLDRVLV